MKKSLSKILNLSNLLFDSYQQKGKEAFLEEFSACLLFISSSLQHQPDEINRRYAALVTGLLPKFLGDNVEEVLRAQASICEKSFQAKDSEAKAAVLIEEFDAFLQSQETGIRRFSDKVYAFIKGSPTEELRLMTVESIADEFGYSFSHLSKKFKKEQGMNIQDVLIYEKLNRIFKLLSSPEDHNTVASLSQSFGFSDPEYFSKVFKKKFGMPPSSIKKHLNPEGY